MGLGDEDRGQGEGDEAVEERAVRPRGGGVFGDRRGAGGPRDGEPSPRQPGADQPERQPDQDAVHQDDPQLAGRERRAAEAVVERTPPDDQHDGQHDEERGPPGSHDPRSSEQAGGDGRERRERRVEEQGALVQVQQRRPQKLLLVLGPPDQPVPEEAERLGHRPLEVGRGARQLAKVRRDGQQARQADHNGAGERQAGDDQRPEVATASRQEDGVGAEEERDVRYFLKEREQEQRGPARDEGAEGDQRGLAARGAEPDQQQRHDDQDAERRVHLGDAMDRVGRRSVEQPADHRRQRRRAVGAKSQVAAPAGRDEQPDRDDVGDPDRLRERKEGDQVRERADAGQHPVQAGRPEAHEQVLAPGGDGATGLDRGDLEEADVQERVQAIRVADERPAAEQAESKEEGGAPGEEQEREEGSTGQGGSAHRAGVYQPRLSASGPIGTHRGRTFAERQRRAPASPAGRRSPGSGRAP